MLVQRIISWLSITGNYATKDGLWVIDGEGKIHPQLVSGPILGVYICVGAAVRRHVGFICRGSLLATYGATSDDEKTTHELFIRVD